MDTINSLLINFLKKNNIKDIFAYEIDYSNNVYTIYTSKPGLWIGRHGKTIEKLIEEVSKYEGDKFKIDIKSIKGHFLDIV